MIELELFQKKIDDPFLFSSFSFFSIFNPFLGEDDDLDVSEIK